MAEEDFREELGQIRQRIQQKKESSKLTELFKGTGGLEVKKAGVKKVRAVRELEEDKRIIGAVKAFLDFIPQELMGKVEAKYPKTMTQLFKLSERIIDGSYGARLQVAGRSQSYLITDWDVMIALLIIHVSKTLHPLETSKDVPEILEAIKNLPLMSNVNCLVRQIDDSDVEKVALKEHKTRTIVHNRCRGKIDELILQVVRERMEKEVLLRFFRRYLNNLANPSHVSVDMLLKKEASVDKTIKTATAIKSKTERSKSFVNIVDNLFSTNRVDKALKVVGSIKAKKEIAKPLTDLVKRLFSPKRKDIDQLIESNQIKEAIDMVKSLDDPQERDKILQRIVSGLAKHNLVERALRVAKAITDSNTRAFALSSMVSALVSIEAFGGAMKVASIIEDPGFREDAHSYIVRGLLDKKPFNEVIAFVENLEDSIERIRAAKIILSSVVASRNKERINEVCSRFALAR
ncbi:MAG: hypothetical protein ACE5GN_00925 [Waddliaceae bacterium]